MFRTEIADFSAEFRDVFINKMKETSDPLTDFMWDWSSTPCLPKVEGKIERLRDRRIEG